VQGFALSGERVRAQFAVGMPSEKKIATVRGGHRRRRWRLRHRQRYRRDADYCIVLEGRRARRLRKLVDESTGGVGYVDDGFAVAGQATACRIGRGRRSEPQRRLLEGGGGGAERQRFAPVEQPATIPRGNPRGYNKVKASHFWRNSRGEFFIWLRRFRGRADHGLRQR